MLGVDHLIAQLHIEDATGASDQDGFDIQIVLQFGRQTGRLGFVASATTVVNQNIH